MRSTASELSTSLTCSSGIYPLLIVGNELKVGATMIQPPYVIQKHVQRQAQ